VGIWRVPLDKNESAVKRFVQEETKSCPSGKRAASTKATRKSNLHNGGLVS
jgi:hypothetical protein